MELHNDRLAFQVIIDKISNENKIRRDVLEKDYYVTLILEELSKKENQNYTYFKGGTALYKCLHSIKRFSEDIDLTVNIDNCKSKNQEKERLKESTLKYKSLELNKGSELVNKNSIEVEYLYKSMFTIDTNDSLQRFGKVKIEATNFTVSEPTNTIKIAPHLYELSNDVDKKILEELYGVKPFNIETITLERIFVDKIFAAEFYYEREQYNDVAKHIYDITILMKNKDIIDFLSNKKKFSQIVLYKRREELDRKGGVDASLAMKDFQYFNKLKNDSAFIDAFYKMQNIYVFNEADKIKIEEIFESLIKLQGILKC